MYGSNISAFCLEGAEKDYILPLFNFLDGFSFVPPPEILLLILKSPAFKILNYTMFCTAKVKAKHIWKTEFTVEVSISL